MFGCKIGRCGCVDAGLDLGLAPELVLPMLWVMAPAIGGVAANDAGAITLKGTGVLASTGTLSLVTMPGVPYDVSVTVAGAPVDMAIGTLTGLEDIVPPSTLAIGAGRASFIGKGATAFVQFRELGPVASLITAISVRARLI